MNNTASRKGYDQAEQDLQEANRLGNPKKIKRAETRLIREYAMAYNEAYSGDTIPSDGIEYPPEEFHRTPIEKIVGITNFVVNKVRNIYTKV